MRTALLKKSIVYCLSTIVFSLSLLTFALTTLPKTTSAAGNCAFTYSLTPISAGSTLTVSVGGDPSRIGHLVQGSVTDSTGATVSNTASGNMPPASPLILNMTINSGTPAGTFTVVVGDTIEGDLCISNNPGLTDKITVTAAGVPSVGVVCDETTKGTEKTDAEAVNMENICRIKYTIYDDKATTFNIIAGLADGFYKLLSGRSRLYPQTDTVTAGTGALASSGKMVAALYNHPPVSGIEYLAGEFNKFNPVAPVYAQAGGIGFSALQPVQDIWESFRNIAYIGFVLVFVIIGFMVMFRAHISPQAVATVQDSLPRIVIALFLVTFSYAIAGFMIDAMFLLLNVIINALPGIPESKQYVFKQSVFGAIWGSWTEVFGTVSSALTTIIGQITDLGAILDSIIKYFGGVVGALVVGIALLFVMFKVFIMLLTSYAYIVILTITAPFFFLAQALPGNNSGSTWFKQMAANVSVFPVVAIMFIFAGILGGVKSLGGAAGGAVQSNSVGNFPLLSGDIDPNAVGKLIAVGILLMTPSAAELIKNAIGAKGPQGGGGAGAALAAGAAVMSAGPRAIAGGVTPRVGAAVAARTPILKNFYGKGPGTQQTGDSTNTSTPRR